MARVSSFAKLGLILAGLVASLPAAAAYPCPGQGCDGVGESEEWRVEFVDRSEYPYYFRMRATSKVDGSSTTWRMASPYGGSMWDIQVHRSRAVIVSYLTRGLYHVVLHDLAEQRQVAQFHGYYLVRSPDDRYLLYRIGYSAVGPWDARVFLLDLQAIDEDEALIAGRRGRCDLLVPCAVEVGTPVYELPSPDDGVRGATWDLQHRRLFFTAPDSEDGRTLFVLSLAGDTPEIVCRVPIHRSRVQGEFSAPLLLRYVDGFTYEAAEDVAVVEVRDQNDVRSEYRVSLAEACAGQGSP